MDMAASSRVSFSDIIETTGDIESHRESGADNTVVEAESSTDSCSSLVVANQEPALSSVMGQEAKIVQAAKKIGGQYTRHQFAFVLTVGVVLSFNAGYVNGACLSGLVTPSGVQQSVAGFTGAYTVGALSLADGETEVFRRQSFMIMSFILGACTSGFMTPDAKAHRLEPSYGPTFLLGGILLIIASVLAAYDEETYFFFLVAAANGIQNGISSLYSANLIRSTHLTGTSTDIGLFLGQLLRGETKNLWKLIVLCILATSFWTGGLISYFVTRQATHYSLLFNASIYVAIGTALIIFLVHELHISMTAALMGNWMWDKVFDHLEIALRKATDTSQAAGQVNDLPPSLTRSQHFAAYFDSLHLTHGLEEGLLDGATLFKALKEAGIQISRNEVEVLIEKADEDGNDRLSRDEWIRIARRSKIRRSSVE